MIIHIFTHMVKFNKLEVLKSSHASTTSQMLPAHTTIKCLVKLTIFFNTKLEVLKQAIFSNRRMISDSSHPRGMISVGATA
jgi:hypothetical protein